MKKKIPSWAVVGAITSMLSIAAGGVVSVLNDRSDKEKRYQELLRFSFSEYYLRNPVSEGGIGAQIMKPTSAAKEKR